MWSKCQAGLTTSIDLNLQYGSRAGRRLISGKGTMVNILGSVEHTTPVLRPESHQTHTQTDEHGGTVNHRWPLVGTSELTLQAAGLTRWGRRPVSIYILSKIEESFPCLWRSGPEQNWNTWDGYRTAQDSSQHLGCWAQEHHISGSSDSRTALGRGWWRWCTCFLLGHRLPALLIKAISRMAWETSESKQFVKPVKQNGRQPRPHPYPTPTSSSTTPPQWTH